MSLTDTRNAATWSTRFAGPAGDLERLAVPDIEGRQLRIQLAGTDFLQLAEVEVIGVESGLPPFGTPAVVG